MNIITNNFNDISSAINNALIGDELNFYIKNNIVFTNAISLNKRLSLKFINDSDNDEVSLLIQSGGAFRHFITGFEGLSDDLAIRIQKGVVVNGMGTGGGFQISGNRCLLSLEECRLTNCYATSNGAAIIIYGNVERSRLVIDKTLVDKCQSNITGAIFSGDCEIIIKDSELTDNHSRSSGNVLSITSLTNNLGSILTITNSYVHHNSGTSSSGTGGAIRATGTIITIEDSKLNYNSSSSDGGAIQMNHGGVGPEGTALFIKNSELIGNKTGNTGGAISVSGDLGACVIENSIISENETINEISGEYYGGGGIAINGETALEIINTKVMKNKTFTNGGGIMCEFAKFATLKGTSEVTENIAGGSGGGISGNNILGLKVEETVKITNNYADCEGNINNDRRGGGGIAIVSSYLETIVEINNFALISENAAKSYGGGIWCRFEDEGKGIINLDRGLLEKNMANFGGGIALESANDIPVKLNILNSMIKANKANVDGGGIYIRNSLVEIENSQVRGNIAGNNGGGIFTDDLNNVKIDSETTQNQTIFDENIATKYFFWTITSGGDSDIHKSHVFTKSFSSWTPIQTIFPENWTFTNAYNNYDINYNQQSKTFTIHFANYDDLKIIGSTTINSFLGATITIPPKYEIKDYQEAIWRLYPLDQPEQTLFLSNPEEDYVLTFYYREYQNKVSIVENYVDCRKCKIRNSISQIIDSGSKYRKTVPLIEGYSFIGYRINKEPLKNNCTIKINEAKEDTTIVLIYQPKNPIMFRNN